MPQTYFTADWHFSHPNIARYCPQFRLQGVKAKVLFFDNRPAQEKAVTQEVWVYDYRTNVHHTLKKKTDAVGRFTGFYYLLLPRRPFKAGRNLSCRKQSRRTLA